MTYRTKKPRKALRYDQITQKKAWDAMPKEERKYLWKFVEQTQRRHADRARKALDDYLVIRYRGTFKAARDAARDKRERVLVGARMPRETAEQVKRAAEGKGVSVYRWVSDAIEKALDDVPF